MVLVRCILLFFIITTGSALDFNNTYTPDSQYCNPIFQNLPSNNKKCYEQSFRHSQDFGLLSEGSTTIDYTLEKNIASEKVSITANYSKNDFIAQLLNSYEKDTTANDGHLSDTIINLIYQNKFSETFITTVSQSLFLPTQSNNTNMNPANYTTTLEAQYYINNTYKIFTKNNYSYLEKASNTLLHDSYSSETGISYTNNKHTSLATSYSQVKNKDVSIKTKKISTLTLKHKINKKIKTSLTIHKSFTSYPEENKASVKINYAF